MSEVSRERNKDCRNEGYWYIRMQWEKRKQEWTEKRRKKGNTEH